MASERKMGSQGRIVTTPIIANGYPRMIVATIPSQEAAIVIPRMPGGMLPKCSRLLRRFTGAAMLIKAILSSQTTQTTLNGPFFVPLLY
jgi:hypothetical protein